MSYAVYDCKGNLLVEPDLRTMKKVIADMLTDPAQESSVSLAHKKGWVLTYNQKRTMVSDRIHYIYLNRHVNDPELTENPVVNSGVNHQKEISADEALLLWSHLARNNIQELRDATLKWPRGYGLFSEEVASGVYYIPGIVVIDEEIKYRELVAYIGDKRSAFHCKLPSLHIETPFINDVTLSTYDVRESKQYFSAKGNFLGKVGSGNGPDDKFERRITELDCTLTYHDDALEFSISGATAEKYSPWTTGNSKYRDKVPDGRLEFKIKFTVLDQELNKVIRTGRGDTACKLLEYRNRIIFRDNALKILEW